MPAIFVAGNYVDIHDNHNCNIYATDKPSSDSPEPCPEQVSSSPRLDLFCRITQHAIETGHAQEVEDELRSASVSAPKLVKAIKTNEALGYLDTQNLSSTELYDLLNEHYHLPFKPRNFSKYRSTI